MGFYGTGLPIVSLLRRQAIRNVHLTCITYKLGYSYIGGQCSNNIDSKTYLKEELLYAVCTQFC